MRTILALLFFVPFLAQAETITLSSYELKNPDLVTLDSVTRYFSLESKKGNTFEVVVPAEQAGLFLSLAPRAELVDADIAATAQARLHSLKLKSFSLRDGYRTITEVQQWMEKSAADHPGFVSVVNYGTSAAGRSLLALRLNNGFAKKPALMITAATHGDELITTAVLTRLIDKLIAGYRTDPRLTAMLDRHDLYFVPVLNVDGYSATARWDGRADPNRSYPYPGHEDAKPTASIAGIIHLFEQIEPVASLDFHAYGGMVMYPWAYTHDPIDEASRTRLHAITQNMAATNDYAYGPISDVIYIAPGSSADYYFWKTRTMGIAVEIGDEKIPDPSEFPQYVKSQEESLWRFIESF